MSSGWATTGKERMDYLPTECAGCKATIEPEVGRYYCDTCVAQQLIAQQDELEAFDAFHAWADSVGRKS